MESAAAVAHRKKPQYEIDYAKSVGHGSFATVYKCWKTGQPDSTTYAVKKANKKPEYDFLIQREKEVALRFKEMAHPNLLHVEDVYEDDDALYIYTKFYALGTLESYIRTTLPAYEVPHIFRGIVEGLNHLHANKIVHRDMKTDNVLLELRDGQVFPVISDLGFARDADQGQMMGTMIGTPVMMSPELHQGLPYTSAVDIWALGILLYKLVFGEYPFRSANMMSLIKTGQFVITAGTLTSAACLQTIEQCLRDDPDSRPTTKKLLESPLCTKEWDKLDLVYVKRDFRLSTKELLFEKYKSNQYFCEDIKQ